MTNCAFSCLEKAKGNKPNRQFRNDDGSSGRRQLNILDEETLSIFVID